MTYVSIPIETDEDLTAADAYAYIQSQFPNWSPSEGQLDVWIIMAMARVAADLKDKASTVSTDIFRYFGPLVGVIPQDEIPATATTDWTLTDNAGHTIAYGTRVGVLDTNLDTHEFIVAQDVVVPAGNSVALNVPIVSTTAGAQDNGLGTAGSQVTPLDGTVWVASITLDAATSGGADAEDDDAYMSRLADVLRTLTPRPILANDFAILARDIAGVGRSVALDGYNPATGTYNNEKYVTVAIADANGLALSAATKTAVQQYLDSLREVNFVVSVIDPTYTTIDIQWDVNQWGGFDVPTLTAAINTALANFINPVSWGQPPGGDPNVWYARPTVKINDIIAVIGAVPGVKDVNSVLMRPGSGSYAATDITMTGAAPLPLMGVSTGTIH